MDPLRLREGPVPAATIREVGCVSRQDEGVDVSFRVVK